MFDPAGNREYQDRNDESELVEDLTPEEDVVEIESTLLSSSEAFMILNQLQEFIEAEEEKETCSDSVCVLTKKIKQLRIASEKQKTLSDYFVQILSSTFHLILVLSMYIFFLQGNL